MIDKEQVFQAVSNVAAAEQELDRVLDLYVRSVLGCPKGEIVVEMPTNGRRFLVEKIHHPRAEHIYISGRIVKKDGELGLPMLGTFVDSPRFECCLSNRLPR